MKKVNVVPATNGPNVWLAYVVFPVAVWILLGVGFGMQYANSLSEFVDFVLHTPTSIYSAAIADLGPTETGRSALLFVLGFHLVTGLIYSMPEKIWRLVERKEVKK